MPRGQLLLCASPQKATGMVSRWRQNGALQHRHILGSCAGGHPLLGLAPQEHCLPIQRPLVALHTAGQTQLTEPQARSWNPLHIRGSSHGKLGQPSRDPGKPRHALLPAGPGPPEQGFAEPGWGGMVPQRKENRTESKEPRGPGLRVPLYVSPLLSLGTNN